MNILWDFFPYSPPIKYHLHRQFLICDPLFETDIERTSINESFLYGQCVYDETEWGIAGVLLLSIDNLNFFRSQSNAVVHKAVKCPCLDALEYRLLAPAYFVFLMPAVLTWTHYSLTIKTGL